VVSKKKVVVSRKNAQTVAKKALLIKGRKAKRRRDKFG